LHARLPHTLSPEEIRAINSPSRTIYDHRSYRWNGWDFDLPPGVFHPSETSRPESVRTTARHYERIVGADGPPLVPVVADVWAGFPDGVQVDVVTFTRQPSNSRCPTTPDIVRNVCVGRDIAARFVGQLVSRNLLSPGGVVYLIVSNTAALRDIVMLALDAGFDAEVVHVQDWPGENAQTYLFALRHENRVAPS
jgi:release factor glutamine methyltransferase